MAKVAFIGWRGMVGSVLLDRMIAEKDLQGCEPFFLPPPRRGSWARISAVALRLSRTPWT